MVFDKLFVGQRVWAVGPLPKPYIDRGQISHPQEVTVVSLHGEFRRIVVAVNEYMQAELFQAELHETQMEALIAYIDARCNTLESALDALKPKGVD